MHVLFSYKFSVLWIGLAVLFTACPSQNTTLDGHLNDDPDAYQLPYSLNEPDAIFDLPPVLKEISGLSSYQDQQLVAVQDEVGKLFFLEIHSGDIKRTIEFSADGDYEGVACTDTQGIYVLRADGVLFRIWNWEKNIDSLVVDVTGTPLSELNNTEGLTFDPLGNRLLVACKGEASLNKEEKDRDNKAVYGFNLGDFSFDDQMALVLNKKQIKTYLKEDPRQEQNQKMWKRFKKGKNLNVGLSAIAIHPKSSNIYILAAEGNALFILDQQNSIVHIEHLPSSVFEQPEAITFLGNGDLFIASEGKRNAPKLFRFNWQP